MDYKEKLKDARWLKKRFEVLQHHDWRCQLCGSDIGLQIHHPRYIPGREPWEYSVDELMCLCEECHKEQHGLIATEPRYTEEELREIAGISEKETYYAPRSDIFMLSPNEYNILNKFISNGSVYGLKLYYCETLRFRRGEYMFTPMLTRDKMYTILVLQSLRLQLYKEVCDPSKRNRVSLMLDRKRNEISTNYKPMGFSIKSIIKH